jgi:DHA3 family tetracycline resistance protein-like MFS transporter
VDWFGVVRGVLAVVSLVTTEVVRRRVDTSRSGTLGQALMWNAGGIVLALAGFGLTRSFLVAVVLYWAVGVMRGIHGPLSSTWFNQRIDDPQVRAMMFSVRGQVGAVGQIGSGPIVGMISNVSIRAALVASAAILSPVLPLYWITVGRDE